MRTVWWNEKLIPESEAKISIYDSAMLFGDTIFEMTRSFNKVQFKLREHLERLQRSAKYVRMPFPYSIEELEKACADVQTANDPFFEKDDEHRLMINITRGPLAIYEQVDGVGKGPNVIIADFPLRWTTQGMGRLFDEGINCVIPSQRTIPASLLEPKVKNRSRLHYLMANIEVSQYKGDNNWPLLLDNDGFIAEGTGCNFFIVRGDRIFTPEGRNCLRGISRDYIDELYEFEESNIEPYDVLEADESFVTATPFCMLPVSSLNGLPIGNGVKSFTLFDKLLHAWGIRTNVDIKTQIQSWDKGIVGGTTPYQFQK